MAFHPGIAYGIAILTVASLTCMGALNRRQGFRKETTNGLLDILMAWAQAKEENRQTWAPKPTVATVAPVAPPDIRGQLAALGAALAVNSGLAPAEPVEQPKQQAVSQTNTTKV